MGGRREEGGGSHCSLLFRFMPTTRFVASQLHPTIQSVKAYIQYLRDAVQPRVQSVTPHSQVRLVKLVFLGPAEWRIPEPLLDDGVEPGQEEIESGPLVRLLTRMRWREWARGGSREEEREQSEDKGGGR